MTKMKSLSKGIIITGLWPLDHELYYNWQHTTHKKSIWKQWIFMAHIEKISVTSYQVKIFCKCPSSALIYNKLEILLSPLCNTTIVSSRSKGDSGKTPSHFKFYWLDKIKVKPEPVQGREASQSRTGQKGPQEQAVKDVEAPFYIQEVKSEQLHQEETQAMVVDIMSIFKKLHSTKAGLAIWGQEGFFWLIVKKLDDLKVVCINNPHFMFTIQLTICIFPSGIHAEHC